MEEKIIREFLTGSECEQFIRVLEIILQCREIERRLAVSKCPPPADHLENIKKHMTLLIHSRLCQMNKDVGFYFETI